MFEGMKISEVAKLPGVNDIRPVMARGRFAKALMAERDGDHAKAEQALNDAAASAIN